MTPKTLLEVTSNEFFNRIAEERTVVGPPLSGCLGYMSSSTVSEFLD